MTHPLVLWSNEHPIGDAELGALLTETYVGGGFTDPAVAARLFEPGAVRARGDLLHVRSSDGGLAGVLILVRGTAPASRFAGPTEAELHLLAVRGSARRSGVGRALVSTAIEAARARGHERLLLWTQPSMLAARALYVALGFRARPERDFEQNGRQFLFYDLELASSA
jgi:ribosomal protein S18 acetylase RimI-like enzyme